MFVSELGGVGHLWYLAKFILSQILAVSFANKASWQNLSPKFEMAKASLLPQALTTTY